MATIPVIALLLIFLMCIVNMTDLPDLEPIFRPLGGDIEMGYCFGADYIVVYKSVSEGDLLLANSSEHSWLPQPSSLARADLKDRVTTTNHTIGLLGLEIHSLRLSDSGIYRRECWEGQQLVNQKEHLLSVCLQETSPKEVTLLPGGGADLHCNYSLAHQEIRWYWEAYPGYTRTLFLDTGLSLEPLPDNLRGHLQVHNSGSSLHIPSAVIKSRYYYCLVMEGEQCLSFQKIHLLMNEADAVFRSVGEEVTLPCPSQHLSQGQAYWDTPFGRISQTSRPTEVSVPQGEWTYILEGNKSSNYSLVIPLLSTSHSGVYKCILPSHVIEYSLYVCPERDPVSVFFTAGDSTVLNCNPGLEDSYNVQWYRRTNPNQELLILDSEDPSQQVPKELYGRVNMSHYNYSLLLFNLSPADSGEYWCVVLSGLDYMNGDDHWDSEDYEESDIYLQTNSPLNGDYLVDSVSPPNGDDSAVFWDDGNADYCILRQKTHLTFTKNRDQDDPTGIDTMLYTVCTVIVGCVILGIICIVITVLWKTRLRRSQPGHSAERGNAEDTTLSERLAPADNTP